MAELSADLGSIDQTLASGFWNFRSHFSVSAQPGELETEVIVQSYVLKI